MLENSESDLQHAVDDIAQELLINLILLNTTRKTISIPYFPKSGKLEGASEYCMHSFQPTGIFPVREVLPLKSLCKSTFCQSKGN